MNQPAKASEPTMEEILASIRRIIADDDAAKSGPLPGKAAPVPPAPANSQDDIDAMLAGFDAGAKPPAPEVLELTESMQLKPPFGTIEAPPDLEFDEAPEAVAPPAAPAKAPPPAPPPEPEPEHALMSPRTTAMVDMAFNSLAHTVLAQNSRTLEDLVREMLKPMLKAWLDDNLPNMVERLVRAEIERVSRGRG
jgi:uncharacterized protein